MSKFSRKIRYRPVKLSLNDAAKTYKGLPHQIAAFKLVEDNVPLTILAEFADTYQAATEYPACPPHCPE